MLPDAADLSIRRSQRLAQRVRRGGWRDQVERFLRAMLVRALIEDEFAAPVRKSSKLQTPGIAPEKRVVLFDLDRSLRCKGGGLRCERFHAMDMCLDFDVAGHGCVRLDASSTENILRVNPCQSGFIRGSFFPARRKPSAKSLHWRTGFVKVRAANS